MIRTVLHISESTAATEKELSTHVDEIVQQSKDNNSELELTGVLAHDEVHFLHILEGEKECVDKVLGKIEVDQRNENFNVMFDVLWHQRLFWDWRLLDKPSVECSKRFNNFLKTNIDALALLEDNEFDVLSKFVENVFH